MYPSVYVCKPFLQRPEFLMNHFGIYTVLSLISQKRPQLSNLAFICWILGLSFWILDFYFCIYKSFLFNNISYSGYTVTKSVFKDVLKIFCFFFLFWGSNLLLFLFFSGISSDYRRLGVGSYGACIVYDSTLST